MSTFERDKKIFFYRSCIFFKELDLNYSSIEKLEINKARKIFNYEILFYIYLIAFYILILKTYKLVSLIFG